MTIAVRMQLLGVSAAVLVGLLAACASPQPPDSRKSQLRDSAAELGDLTTRLHEDMLLRHKMDRFAAIASDHYIVMIPGGSGSYGEVVARGSVGQTGDVRRL